jgi:hypothetical protein
MRARASTRAQNRRSYQGQVRLVQATHHITQTDPDVLGQARGDDQHLFLAVRARQTTRMQSHNGRFPIHERRHRAIRPGIPFDEQPNKIIVGQPEPVPDQQLNSCPQIWHTPGMSAQRRRKVLEAGSKTGVPSVPWTIR